VIVRAGGATALCALALCAPSSEAALQTFGSALSAQASIDEARQSDTAYWQTAAAGGSTAGVAPAAGSIRSFKLKGVALSRPVAGISGGETLFHLQALRPMPNAPGETSRVIITSQGFDVPQKMGANEQAITTYEPENFCVAKGDVLAFNTVGGWDGIPTGLGPYPNGTRLRIFAPVPGALVSQFNGADQTNNGDILKHDHVRGQGQELLMQLTLATGEDAAGPCPTSAPIAPKVEPDALPQRTKISSERVTVAPEGSLSVALFCSAPSAARWCNGIVRVLSRERRPRLLAARGYTIAPGKLRGAALRLSSNGRKLFSKANRRLSVNIQTVTSPGGPVRTVTQPFTLRARG